MNNLPLKFAFENKEVDYLEDRPDLRGWYVVGLHIEDDTSCSFFYLHSDKVWRNKTIWNGSYSGYYKTREDAQEMLDFSNS